MIRAMSETDSTAEAASEEWSSTPKPPRVAYRVARWSLAAFLVTFIAARILVILIMARAIPDLYLHVKGNHVHHLNYGIFLLSGIGAYLLFFQPKGKLINVAATVYGIGLALTFDEFGMWLHLGGPYWQRGSFDAVVVVAALLGLFAVAPDFKKFGPGHWATTFVVLALTAVFGVMLTQSIQKFGHRMAPTFQRLEANSPE